MEEKKVSVAYTVVRYENGEIELKNAEGYEGATALSVDGISKDIEDVANIVSLKRTENAAYMGVRRFYAEVQAAQEEAAAAAAQAEGTITK